MASKYTKINKTISELRNFLDYYFEEYQNAYTDIYIKKGWRIEHYENEIYDILSNLWNSLYLKLYINIQEGNPATDKEILETIHNTYNYLDKSDSTFEKIIEASDDNTFSLAESIVFNLVHHAKFKLDEIIQLSEYESTLETKVDGNTELLVGIITATDKEKEAIMNLLEDVRISGEANDPNTYEEGYFIKNDKKIRIIHSRCLDQGMQSATSLTTKLILKYSPKIMFMIGHQAGNLYYKDNNKLGDILIGEETVDYQQVEVVQRGLEPDNIEIEEVDKKHRIYVEKKLIEDLKYFKDNFDINEIRVKSKHYELFDTPLNVRIGKIVTGSALIRSNKRFVDIIKSNKGSIGLDMESHGFYYACKNTYTKYTSPLFVSIKSISDFGEHRPKYNKKIELPHIRQEYACSTSSLFVFEFIFHFNMSSYS